jgi:hypothetical protein
MPAAIVESNDIVSTFPVNDIINQFTISQTREETKTAERLFNTTLGNTKNLDGKAIWKLLELKHNMCARALMEATYMLPGGSHSEKNVLVQHFNYHKTDFY